VPYEWIKFLHVLAAIFFAAAHGAAIFMVFAIRRSQDRARLLAILDFSGRTTLAMYVGLVSIVATGLWMGFVRTFLLEKRWFWLSLIVLVLVTVLMILIAKPYTERLRAATEMRPSGVPRTSDAELAEMVRSRRVDVIALIGIVGLVGILYLMLLKPDLGESRGAAPPAGTTTVAAVSTTVTMTTSSLSRTTSTSPSEEEALLAVGREIFEVTAGGVGCAFCHGTDGGGSAYGPNIRRASRQDIANALRWAGEMSQIRLSEMEVDAVALYLSQLD
jgi:mono/diheme cytochrome c family protein